ncbi:mediator complex, subunit Med5 [Lasiosphaeria ovina]|uniref:Mediator of RNA polymerase II transcription subunit 5 n=1 Tax=Lasiosphaeria ovina TaxID=92902 RepID=A0AAE0KBY9_9PEZI|nr:mediator complex, subunit Med5 [Lasiosphaeria ovina]
MDRRPRAGLPAAVAQWIKFLSNAHARRLDVEDFASFAPILSSKHPLPRTLVAELLLRPTKDNQDLLDPRVPQYLEALLKLKLVDAPSVLRALYKFSTAHSKAHPAPAEGNGAGNGNPRGHASEQQQQQRSQKVLRWRSSYSSEEVIFWRLAKHISVAKAIKTGRDAVELLTVLAKWMTLFADAAAAYSRDAYRTMHSLRAKDELENSRAAFNLLILGVFETETVLSVLGRQEAKELRKQLSDSLDVYVPSLMQAPSEIASRIEHFRSQTLASFDPTDKKDTAVSEMNRYMDNLIGLDSFQVPEIQLDNSRAGLYIYLNAALVGRPLVDDTALFTYMHNRYQGDLNTMAIQLILASFDVLANAVFRGEGAKTGHLLKSYLVNKVPLILRSLAASSTMYSFNAELCISQALGQVDTNVFPTLSGLFDMHNSGSGPSFQDSVRQDFCFACQLHGLLSPNATENLLGDITYQSLPDEGRYIKETLVEACLEDLDRTQKLIRELDEVNGNVGAAAQAITEVIRSLCRNKDTMTLKQVCSQLASKPVSLDILLLFEKPERILHPLCEILDNWSGYDEDQGEYQPVYEEFGSILLLLLAFTYRYSFTLADLGIRSADSFMGKLLSRGQLCRPLEEFSEQEKSHMNGWIHGLFDSEAGGLGDELMASCPPQDFYLLMPTLFHHIVLALSTGYLTEEMLKGGLEYLVDVLLLPSLVPALLFLSNRLWADEPQGQRAIIKILQLILVPHSISNEASALLSSVLNTVAKPLEHALRSYQRQDPKSPEVEPLLRALKDNLPVSRRTGGGDHSELEQWTATIIGPKEIGGLSAAVRQAVQGLIQWAQQSSLNGLIPTTTYCHQQTLVAIQMLGAKHVLWILLEELKAFTEAGNAPVAYDVVTAIVCAPDVKNDASTAAAAAAVPDETGAFPASLQRRLTLRDALKAEADDWKKIQKSNEAMAETVVRLYRRVEAQMALPPPPAAILQPELGALGGDELDEAAMTAAVATMVDSSVDAMTIDTTGLGSGVDLGDLGLNSGANSAVGGLDMSNDDIFGGLTGVTDFTTDFSNWDTMELG